MKITKSIIALASLLMAFGGVASAQDVTNVPQWPTPWVAARRQVLAVTYRENKQTTVTMAGTAIAPRAVGKADVEFKQGRTNVRLEMNSFSNPQALGGFYTTYVLWAVAPEGQAENLMELPIDKAFKIESTTKFQTFGLIITAEPHSRVELPSPMIVAENSMRDDTRGLITLSKVEYSGDPGTFYTIYSPTSMGVVPDYDTPLLILGARRAVEIAQRADARTFADKELRESEQKLVMLEQGWPRARYASDRRNSEKKNSGLAHDVMRIAEQARKLSVERGAQARLAAERRRADENIAQANSEADLARLAAQRASVAAEHASNDAERARVEAARARMSERDQAARAANDALEASARLARSQSETDAAKASEALARDDAERARIQAADANRDRDAARQNLYLSLSTVLETRREARGLIVNLSDVLFDTGQTTLKLGAREKLSNLAAILLSYPGTYQIEIEGHTDSVGSDESNLYLSRGRAESVRDYLILGGIKSENVIAARGFGESKPVADNETASGRQVNRRVEIIIQDHVDRQANVGVR